MPSSDPDSSLLVDVAAARPDAPAVRGLARWLAATAPRRARGAVTIALVSDARMRALNREFRGVDRATDVLSFPSAAVASSDSLSAAASEGKPRGAAASSDFLSVAASEGKPLSARAELGDIAIARGVAARQARDAGHTLSTEVRVLALHGLLHLLGYDHERDTGQMARLEARLRRRGGLPGGLIERAGTARPSRRRRSPLP